MLAESPSMFPVSLATDPLDDTEPLLTDEHLDELLLVRLPLESLTAFFTGFFSSSMGSSVSAFFFIPNDTSY